MLRTIMRLLVCGGRDWDDFETLSEELVWIAGSESIDVIILGGAPGADRMAGEWAKLMGYPVEVYEADWEKHGRAAGPIRNKRMLDEGKPDLVLSFPGGRGTRNMIEQATKAGVRVKEVQAAGW
jgi:hypothetical protein